MKKKFPSTKIPIQQIIINIIRNELYIGGNAEQRIAQRVAKIIANNYRRRYKK